MGRTKKRAPQRKRAGRVSYYCRNGGWHVYYREGETQVRRRVGDTEEAAAQIAAQINAQLSTSAPTPFSFVPIAIPELRASFLDQHEHVRNSTLGTVNRYRAATQHLANFALAQGGRAMAHELRADAFVRYLRGIEVTPNGHPNSARRKLRDKGIRYILEVCRSLYVFAARQHHLPPYAENPFKDLGIERFRIEDAKSIFCFDQATELEFFKAADRWSFPIHFTLAKAGLRPGELIHLLISELDLAKGWLQVRNKVDLGWRVKTGRERVVPLTDSLIAVLKRVIGNRESGLVFLRPQYDPATHCHAGSTYEARVAEYHQRIKAEELKLQTRLSRKQQAAIARTVWRDAGLVKADAVRNSFIRTMRAIDHPEATCPKSWRHSFGTLLQDANVDPLIRQVTLGHKLTSGGDLGMTATYTHTRAETQKREIERAVQLWPDSLHFAREWAQGCER